MRIALSTIVFAAACASGPAASDADGTALDEPFRLRIEEEAQFPDEHLVVRFVALVGDSRCPSDVNCIWAGDAEIEMLVARGDEGVSLRLHTHGGGRHPRQAAAFGFTLRLESLDPYPSSAERIPERDYVATLVLLAGQPDDPDARSS